MNSKQITIVGSLSIIVVIASVFWWMLLPTWVSLFPVDISDADKSAVTSVLSEAAIDYKIDDASKKIQIKSEDLTKAHSLLEAKGLPQKNGIGMEMFNNTDYGLSEFVQNINYQRAMEEELVRSIRLIKGIKDARVHLALKKQSIFDDKKEESKASVILTFKDGAIFDKGTIKGVQQIVAAAVPSLSVDSIVILGDNGRVLSYALDDASGTDSNNLEQKYTNSISKLLTSYLGHSMFSVTVDIKFDKKKKVTVAENYFPDSHTGKGYLLKSKQSEKKSDSDNSQGLTQNQNLKDEEFAYSKERSEIIYPTGSVERISAAIVIQGELSNVEKNALQDLISSSLGMEPSRGDVVSVVSINRTEKKLIDKTALERTDLDENLKDKTGEPQLLKSWFGSYGNIIMLAFSIVFAFLMAIIIYLLKSRRNPGQVLSSSEREQLIADLKEWMR